MDTITIRGAREHNLKDITVEIPRNKLVVITGVSGSGKSTLAFDVLYAEGRRRYVESLSAYARQFLAQRAKPDVDSIDGLSPAVAIEQRRTTTSPRSTIGTVTEIADYLRLLYARVGSPHCLECGRTIESQSVPQIVDQLLDLPEGSRLQLLAPIRLFHPDDFDVAIQELRKAGFVRVRINGKACDLAEDIPRPGQLDMSDDLQLDVIIDRLVVKRGIAQRLADSLEMALRYGKDIVNVLVGENEERLFTQRLICPACGFAYPELSPAFFSPNSPEGACPGCDGLGVQTSKKITQKGKAAQKGRAAQKGKTTKQETTDSPPCAECQGRRLRPETQGIRVGGWSLGELSAHSIAEVAHFFTQLTFETQAEQIARPLCKDISARLQALTDLGLEYLTLDRRMTSLSGGEMQRARLATLLGNGLSEVVYILDEPSIGLHPRDTQRLLRTLKQLRDQGNTVVVVEHDPETMRAADYMIDLGPGAGEHGGHVCAQGAPQEVAQAPGSLTGQYLSGELTIPLSPRRRTSEDCLTLFHVTLHNLRDVTVAFPLGTLTCVTGVSGSGKSSLVMDALAPVLAHALAGTKPVDRRIGELSGWQLIDKMIQVDQAPIGRTPSSNPATYIGLLNPLRDLFAQLPEARMRGYGPNRFSFNIRGGRCEACEGNGVLTVEMNFLPDVYVTCDVCRGQRYNRDTLEIQFRGKSIAEILDMTVAEALVVCGDIPKIRPRLETLREVGLEYLRLGQPAPSLSGGEAQRLKLAKELSRKTTGRTVFIFDEPTTGLHLADIQRLLDIFTLLVEAGNTVVVIEHNLEVVKTADFVIDLGPGGGEAGGDIIAIGTPEQISQVGQSYTGRLLKGFLAQ